MRFKEWLLENFIPRLRVKTTDPEEILRIILSGYSHEIEIQKHFGGIRNPPMVIINKIRHLLTNYEDIQQYLSQTSSNPIQKLDRLEDLTISFKDAAEEIVDLLPPVIQIDGLDISKNDIRDSINEFILTKINFLHKEKQSLIPKSSSTHRKSTFVPMKHGYE